MSPPAIDLTNEEAFRGGFPHQAFTWLRENAPVFWHEATSHTPDGEGFWVISRHADVLAVLQDPERFSSEKGGGRAYGGTQLKDDRGAGYFLNQTDDPHHRRLRSLVNKGFSPRRVGRLEDELKSRAGEMLDGLGSGDAFDFVEAARELPLQAICMVLGVPLGDRSMLCEWLDRGIEATTDHVVARESIKQLSDYGGELIRKRRARPGEDIFSVIVHATDDEGGQSLSDRELRAFFTLLFLAGAETTRNAMTGGLLALIENPSELRRLRGEPGLMRSAIEEILRWTTPSVYKRRTATRETTLGGKSIAAGDKLTFWEMSANRDRRVFRDPFALDLGRQPNPHLGFGHGVHFCLGANLARMEIRVMLESLLARNESWELAGEPVWVPNNRLLGLKTLPIRALPDPTD